jgi:RNA recognition motif-containing protein
MQKKLFIGGLSHSMDKDKVRELFTVYGEVETVTIIEGKGFGFVEMATQEAAEQAKAGLNGNQVAGRTLNVNDAHAQKDRSRTNRNRW